MAFPKFQTKEVLNKVLNSGEDALKVDIDNVTLKTEAIFPSAVVPALSWYSLNFT